MFFVYSGYAGYWAPSTVLAEAEPSAGSTLSAISARLRQEYGPSQAAVREKELGEREILSRAQLSDQANLGQRYTIFAAMLVRAPFRLTRDVLTDYPLYVQMIPYVKKADLHPVRKTLELEGGIWKYQLASEVRFTEASETSDVIGYEFVAGHFKGLKGKIFFETAGEQGTRVMIEGELTTPTGTAWPPRLIIERGAEVVFDYTARRMRTFIEEKKKDGKNGYVKQRLH